MKRIMQSTPVHTSQLGKQSSPGPQVPFLQHGLGFPFTFHVIRFPSPFPFPFPSLLLRALLSEQPQPNFAPRRTYRWDHHALPANRICKHIGRISSHLNRKLSTRHSLGNAPAQLPYCICTPVLRNLRKQKEPKDHGSPSPLFHLGRRQRLCFRPAPAPALAVAEDVAAHEDRDKVVWRCS
jgi:hypothetical protein